MICITLIPQLFKKIEKIEIFKTNITNLPLYCELYEIK